MNKNNNLKKKLWLDFRMLTYSGIGRYLQGLLKSGLFWRHPYEVNILSLRPDEGLIDDCLDYCRDNKSIHGKINIKKYSNIKPYNPLEHFFFKFENSKNSILHTPHYNAPLTWKGKLIITIHDIAHIDCAEASPGKYKIGYAKYLIKETAKKATRIITNSLFTKDRIENVLGIDGKKIDVVYFGPGIGYAMDEKDYPRLKIDSLDCKQKSKTENERNNSSKKNYIKKDPLQTELYLKNIAHILIKVKKPYLLFVGNFKPHKNIPRLIQVYDLLRKKYQNFPYSLVLVGKQTGLFSPDRELEKLAGSLIASNDIIVTGILDDDKLCQLYNNADLLIQPSLYEGFGFPPIEALTFNVPVVASKKASLPEILGDSAKYFDPYSVDDMFDVIDTVIHDKTMQRQMIKKGNQRLERYSWHRCAKEHARIYREVAEID